MPGEGRDLSSRRTQDVAKDLEIGQPINSEECSKLQKALHAKAKAEAGYRFYALYDKISRDDILAHAYACSLRVDTPIFEATPITHDLYCWENAADEPHPATIA